MKRTQRLLYGLRARCTDGAAISHNILSSAGSPRPRMLASGPSFGSGDKSGHVLSTHVDADGQTPRMVDVGNKKSTRRIATARSRVRLPPEVTAVIQTTGGEVMSKKGPVFTTAIIAAVQAAKQTSGLIPFCHPLPIENCRVDLTLGDCRSIIDVECTVQVTHKTGVEMEAMTGASVASLTVYDMLKGLSHDIIIEKTRLVSKAGGKRDISDQESKQDQSPVEEHPH